MQSIPDALAERDTDAVRALLSDYDGVTVERPVDRSYVADARSLIPDVNPAFHRSPAPAFTELFKRPGTQELPLALDGPHDAGTRALVEATAGAANTPLITVEGSVPIDQDRLLGSTVIDGETVRWVDGPLLRAAAVAQHEPVVLYIDDADAITNDLVRDSLVRLLLDPPAAVTFETDAEATMTNSARALEHADPQNILCILDTHAVEQLDNKVTALADRTITVDYMDEDREAHFLEKDTPLTYEQAEMFVRAITKFREAKHDGPLSNHLNLSTRSLTKWAVLAHQFAQHDTKRPAAKAAVQVLRPPHADEQTKDRIEKLADDYLYGIFD